MPSSCKPSILFTSSFKYASDLSSPAGRPWLMAPSCVLMASKRSFADLTASVVARPGSSAS